MIKFVTTDSAKPIRFGPDMLFCQPLEHLFGFLRVWLAFIFRRHFMGNQIFKHQGSIETTLVKEFGHIDISLLGILIMTIETVILEQLHSFPILPARQINHT